MSLKWVQTHFSEKVGDDHVRHGISPATDLKYILIIKRLQAPLRDINIQPA